MNSDPHYHFFKIIKWGKFNTKHAYFIKGLKWFMAGFYCSTVYSIL